MKRKGLVINTIVISTICSVVILSIIWNIDNAQNEIDIIAENTNKFKYKANIIYETIDKENWINHPQIKEVRSIYKQIQNSIESGCLDVEIKEYQYLDSDMPTYQAIYYNDEVVKKYVEEGGSGDSYIRKEFYYGDDEILRFMFIRFGAVNGTVIEHRVYFNLNSEKLWEIQRLIDGPGYPFPEKWPDNEVIKTPLKRFKLIND